MHTRLSGKRTQGILLTLLAVFFWLATAIGAFQSVYLQEKGFSASQLGIINAVGSAVNILAISVWGIVSDGVGSLKKVLIVVMTMGLGLNALIPALPTSESYSFVLMIIALACVKFFNGPMYSLTENLLVRNCAEMDLNYGGIRSAASLFYALGGLVATGIVAKYSTGATFWLGGLIGIPAVIFATLVKDSTPVSNTSRQNRVKRSDFKILWTNRKYLIFVAFSFLFYMAMYCRLSFMPYYMSEIGIGTRKYGLVLAYGAFLEIPSFLMLKWLHKYFSYRKLVIISAVLEIAEALLLSTVCNSMGMLLFSTTFYGLGNGMFLAASLNYIYELAPPQMKASTQSFCDAAAAIAGIVGNLLGGAVLDALGAKPFYFVVMLTYVASIATLVLPKDKS